MPVRLANINSTIILTGRLGLHPHISSKALCQSGWGTSTLTLRSTIILTGRLALHPTSFPGPLPWLGGGVKVPGNEVGPTSPYQLSSFVPVRLGNINSDITFNYNINRPSWPSSPYNVNKIQYEPKIQKARLENEQKPRRAEQPLTKQMRFERRPEKPATKKPCGEKNVQEIWLGTRAQAPSDLKPILRRLYKNEIRTTDPTRLDAWYLKKKELNNEKIK